MPFIRLTDTYNDDIKIDTLSDGAYRLWHNLLAYCRRMQTDGLIPKQIMLNCRFYRPKRLDELMQILPLQTQPLVSRVEGFGFQMHNYLKWNPTKDEENERRAESKERMRLMRERRKSPGVPPIGYAVTTSVTDASPPFVTSRSVLERERKREEGKEEVSVRAGALIERYRDEWYPKYRHGAKLRLIGNSLEFQDACSLVATWDDARLEKLATIVLTTDDPFIAGTDRSFKIFALKASWADDRLKQAEQRAS